MEWIKLSEETLPEPRTLVWIKRISGGVYLGFRIDSQLSTNPDASRDCYWHGNPASRTRIDAACALSFHHNFSDITVDSYADVVPPLLPQPPKQV